jgi:hypothetical protein
MKFTPTWQQIALIVVLFAGVIAAYMLAPGAATVITGMATTLIGWLCASPLQPSVLEPTPAPVLSIVKNEEPKQ